MIKRILAYGIERSFFVHGVRCALVALAFATATGASAQESLCARVRIEIQQELAFVRQGFDARMHITNTLDSSALENVRVDVFFKDEDGNPVTATSNPNDLDALFFIRVDSLSGIGNVQGSGTVAPASEAEIHWLIVPAAAAAANLPQGKRYFVGAVLSFTLGGEEQEIEVAPDMITVRPQPELELDYFLTQEVRADDPFTPGIEPAEPFVLGVRVQNSGLGLARNVSIQSAQPRIVENEQGLLIGFEITASFVDEGPATESLMLNFGDLPAGVSKIGRWLMETNLSGTFTDFSARFVHSDELGGRLTSLLKRVSTHFLIKDILVDLPGRDAVTDFLARDGGLISAYESNVVDTIVTDYTGEASLVQLSTQDQTTTYTLDLPATAGMLYFKGIDPLGGAKQINRVTRGDGKRINLKNAWLDAQGSGSETSRSFSLFDAAGGGRYTIEFGPRVEGPRAPVLQSIPDYSVAAGQRLTFVVRASDPDGTTPSISLSSRPAGSTFVDHGDGTAQFDWQTGPSQTGTYPLTFVASDGNLQSARSSLISVTGDGDSDLDGMPDAWELEHFGTTTRDGGGDFDGDGISDRDEYNQGLDPALPDTAPSKPQIISPFPGNESAVSDPVLVVGNSERVGIKPVYEFELYSDPDLSVLIADGRVPEGARKTSWRPPDQLLDNTRYFWRVRVAAGQRYSEWSYGDFLVNRTNDSPGVARVSFPPSGENINTISPVLSVTNSTDIDGDRLSYGFEVATNPKLRTLVASVFGRSPGLNGITSWKVPVKLPGGRRYYWRSIVSDEHGAFSATPWAWFYLDRQSNPPAPPHMTHPLQDAVVAPGEVALRVTSGSRSIDIGTQFVIETDVVPTFDSPLKTVSKPGGVVNGSYTYRLHGAQENQRYYWRARSLRELRQLPLAGPIEERGGTVTGSEWVTSSFLVSGQEEAAGVLVIRNPGANAWTATLHPTLEVSSAADPEQGAVNYQFEIYADSELSSLLSSGEGSDPFWRPPSGLTNRSNYYWRARALDAGGLAGPWTAIHEFRVSAYGSNVAPSVSLVCPEEVLPVGNMGRLAIRWEDSDPDDNALVSLYAGDVEILSGRSEDIDGLPGDEFMWNLNSWPAGRYEISAAINDGSAVFESAERCPVIVRDERPPWETTTESGDEPPLPQISTQE